MARILMIDDDQKLGELVTTYLATHGFHVDLVTTVAQGLAAARREAHDAILLDIMLPDGSGLDVCRVLTKELTTPIIMLTARGDDTDRIVGLELGADDYLPKPFNPRELAARIKAVLRRGSLQNHKQQMQFGQLMLDLAGRQIYLRGEHRPLTQRQFSLLVVLAERSGRVLSREQLSELVRGDPLEAFDRSIDVHISKIRAAIEDDPKKPIRVLTVRGAGYLFTGVKS